MKDLVSIVTPSFNTGKYIKETIESVLSQTYTNWEMLIVDDCSTDNTDEIVSEYLSDRRIRYFKNSERKGAAYSRNLAVREAKGRYIAFLDSDDIWKPDKLEKQLNFMCTNGYSFTCTYYEETDEAGFPLGKLNTAPTKITKRKMFDYCYVGCLTVMYDSTVTGLIQIENLKKNNDYAIWLKVVRFAPCYTLKENLALYRRRAGSITGHKKSSLIKYHFALFREGEKKNPVSAFFLTLRNMFFGVYKKLFYVKKIKR